MASLCEINKPALQYAINASSRMKELAAPLQQCFGICSFSYMRIYNDCRYLSLLNGYEEFNTKYFETIKKSDPHFIKTMQNTAYGEPQFSLWPTEQKNLTPIMSLLDAYNIWHGFQITYRKDNYFELFSFTFDKQSGDKTFFYINNLHLLMKFVDFFRAQAGDLIDDSDKSRLAVFPQKFNLEYADTDLNIETFLSNMNKSLLLRGANGNVAQLTKRESECFKIFTTNKTAKEIANILNLSPRTVELHISNIKHKLGVNYKNQLLDIYSNTF